MPMPTRRPHNAPMLNALIDLVLAPACLACDGFIESSDSARLVCRRCRTRLRALPEPSCHRCGAPLLRTGRTVADTCPECARWPAAVRFARSACLLHPPADRIVHQLKYGGWHALGVPMAQSMLRVVWPAEVTSEVTHVVPVPTTAARRRERGYNQAERVAAAYARLRGLELLDCLRRQRASDSQTALQPLERAANVAGAFQLPSAPACIRDQHVLLVDDVMTTGATS